MMMHGCVDKNNAIKVAQFLLQIEAVKLQTTDPFIWASGLRSPIYCDNRITLSYPEIRSFIRDEFVSLILERFGRPDLIAGVATGGIAQGALIADKLELPFVYVRSESKKHGMGNQIEGHFLKGQKVVVVEDLISTGKSSLQALASLREKELEVLGLVAIFTYGLSEATHNFQQAKCPYATLSNYLLLVEEAKQQNKISQQDVELLEQWQLNPALWHPNR